MKQKIKDLVKEIQNTYRNKLKTNEEIFEHLLNQIEIHVKKLKKLKENKAMKRLFKREVADVHLLALGLIELENIDEEIIKDSADYYLNNIKKEYAIK